MPILALCLSLLAGAPAQTPPARIENVALLRELPSRFELARLPQPGYALETSTKVLRHDEHDGVREAVLAEPKGPGVFVRLWMPEPRGRLRLYLGASPQPALVLEGQAAFSTSGEWPALRTSVVPLLRMPFAFADGARLTFEGPKEPEFELAWRSYPAGTPVADWRRPSRQELEELNATWSRAPRGPEGQLTHTLSLSQKNPAGDFLAADPKLCAGPRAVSELVLRVEGPDPEIAIRGLVLHLWFDGEETVVCPLATFFRCEELEPRIHATWTRDFAARWIMPYRERMELFVENLGPPTTHVSGSVYTLPWSWDERSLHFGARWIAARGPARLSIEGQGLLMGIVPGNIPRSFPGLTAQFDGRPQPLREALALLERAPFEKRLEFELPAHAEPDPQRVAIFYLRPGAKIQGRDPEPGDRVSLLDDR